MSLDDVTSAWDRVPFTHGALCRDRAAGESPRTFSIANSHRRGQTEHSQCWCSSDPRFGPLWPHPDRFFPRCTRLILKECLSVSLCTFWNKRKVENSLSCGIMVCPHLTFLLLVPVCNSSSLRLRDFNSKISQRLLPSVGHLNNPADCRKLGER